MRGVCLSNLYGLGVVEACGQNDPETGGFWGKTTPAFGEVNRDIYFILGGSILDAEGGSFLKAD